MTREELLFYNRAEEIRLSKGYTIAEVERLMWSKYGIYTRGAIRNFERRKTVYWEYFRKYLAKLYEVSLAYLDGEDLCEK